LFEIKIKSCLALYWSSLLMLLYIFMICEIAHFGYKWDSLYTDPSAAFCIHTKVISHSLLCLRPESLQPFHFSTSLSHFYRWDADLFAGVELA